MRLNKLVPGTEIKKKKKVMRKGHGSSIFFIPLSLPLDFIHTAFKQCRLAFFICYFI